MTVGSSKGIFLPTCIIPRMIIRLVLGEWMLDLLGLIYGSEWCVLTSVG